MSFVLCSFNFALINIMWQFNLDKDVILKEFNSVILSNKPRACFINGFHTATVAGKVLL